MNINKPPETGFLHWMAHCHGEKHLDHAAFDASDMRDAYVAGFCAALKYADERMECSLKTARQLAEAASPPSTYAVNDMDGLRRDKRRAGDGQ